MRNLTGIAAAALAVGAALAGVPLDVDRNSKRSPHPGNRHDRIKRQPRSNRKSAEHYAKHDPFYGIASTGRRDAKRRAEAMAVGFAKSRIGLRNARGRDQSNPFLNDKRRQAWAAELEAVSNIMRNPVAARAQAMKNVRRLPA